MLPCTQGVLTLFYPPPLENFGRYCQSFCDLLSNLLKKKSKDSILVELVDDKESTGALLTEKSYHNFAVLPDAANPTGGSVTCPLGLVRNRITSPRLLPFKKGNRGDVIYFVAGVQNAGPISFTVRSAVLPRSCGQVRRDPVQDDRWQ